MIDNTVLLFKQDLENYPTAALKTLQRYLHLPDVDRKDLVWLVAIHQAQKNQMASLPVGLSLTTHDPEGSITPSTPIIPTLSEAPTFKTRAEVMNAMAQGKISRQVGLELMRSLPSRIVEEAHECSPPPEHQDCSNDRDYISQECWSQDFQPEIKIKFLDPTDYTRRPNTLCMRIDDFINTVTNPDNQVRAWYPNDERQESDEDIEPEGYGGKPSAVEKYTRVLTSMYISNQNPEELGSGTFIAYPLYTNKLVGNPEGTFGVSQVHGQEPGYTIYYVTLGTEEQQRDEIIAELKRIHQLKGLPLDFPTQDKDIKELIEEYGAKDEIPTADKISIALEDQIDEIIGFLSSSHACTLMFYKIDDWRYGGMFCNLDDAKQRAQHYIGQDAVVHVTNTFDESEDMFNYMSDEERDIELIKKFALEFLPEWQHTLDRL